MRSNYFIACSVLTAVDDRNNEKNFPFLDVLCQGRNIQFFNIKPKLCQPICINGSSFVCNSIYCFPLGEKLEHETNVKFMV